MESNIHHLKILREHTGLGMFDCRRAMEMALTPEFGGDVMLAVAYIDENAIAVAYKGDRHTVVLGKAGPVADRLRARYPALDAAFPKPTPQTEPTP